MKEYYSHAGITIYHGDCREVIEQWEGLRTASFDLLLTDPPYGLGQGRKNKRGGSGASVQMTGMFAGKPRAASVDYGDDGDWDDAPVADIIPRLRSLTNRQIIFGGNFYELPPARCWLIWDKDNRGTDFADAEMAWTNLDRAVRLLTFRWNGMLQAPGVPHEFRQHPTQKPEPVMRWALMQVPDARTVLDPFLGSGTTLVAAKRLGKTAVGIEREERYCEIAAQRLSQEVLPLEMVP